MADGFESMIHDARAFFAELSQNNTRDWYEAHKERYVEGVKKPAEFFNDLIAEDLSRRTGDAVKPKLFRIHRDVRFSKDKTPYNTHLHMMWSPTKGDALTPSWFFGLGEGYFILGVAVMGLQGDALTQYRQFIDDRGDVLQAALDKAAISAGAEISDWGPPALKRVPKPYPPDHPHAELLKRKALAVSAPIPDNWEEVGLVKALNARIDDLLPIYRVLAA